MSDVRGWLEDLGLGQYAGAFQENAITLDFARDLTDSDLEKLGVAVMGHRKALLRAIDGLSAPRPEPDFSESATLDQADKRVESEGAREAERRQLTVMFCDLVGSTALSETLDPEELRGVMTSYRKVAGDVVTRYDGHVAQYLGDGLMVYFGWPAAHEDDAQRAVRAGLDIVAAVAALEAEAALAVRIGIATGLVVVGVSGADHDTDAKLAVGETPNIAARIQSLAEPSSVAIAQSTRRLLGGAFALDDLGSHDAKGVSGGLQVHRVVSVAETESRFEASQGAAMTPLVGRESEISLLLDRWDQAKDGEGQVVLLSGEAGIGKSRVTQVLRERLADEPHIRLRYQCSPYHTNSAFYPVIAQFERAAGFARDDSPDQKLDKMETALAQGTADVARVAPLIASMLSLPIDRYPALNLSPQRQKDDTIAALAALVTGLAEQKPLLLLFEDAHWCDPTTLDVLTAMIGAIENARVFMVITFRSDFEPPWTGHGHVVAQSLSRLGRRRGAEMVARLTGGKALPDVVLDGIVAKTDGIPLFVEELTKTVMEAGFLTELVDRYTLDGPLPPLAIPATLQDSLMARLDRQASVKEVAQLGAVIGREFSFHLLAAVSSLNELELTEALSELVDAELIFVRGTPPDALFTFKHALLQDAAYSSLLKARRQQLHRLIAESLERSIMGSSDTEPELVAHHLTNAGLNTRALPYWREAGERALARFANKEAIVHLTKALEVLADLPEGHDRDAIELELRLGLGPAQLSTNGHASTEARETYTRAHELSNRAGESRQKFAATWGLWLNYQQRASFETAEKLSRELVTIAELQDNNDFRLQAHHSAWTSLLPRGDLARCYDHAVEGIELYDREAHDSHAHIFGGHDPGVCSRAHAAMSSWLLGRPDRGLPFVQEGIALAQDLEQPVSQMIILNFGGCFYQFRGEAEPARKFAEMAVSLGKKHNTLQHMAIARVIRGWALVANNSIEAGLEEIDLGLSQYRATSAKLRLTYFLSVMAESCLLAGEFERGLRALAEAETISDQMGERWWLAEMHRLRGETLAPSGAELEMVEQSFQKALCVARKQEARSLELRASMSLARLWAEGGRRPEAEGLLASIYSGFTEGFDTADLKDAKALLEELK